MSRPTKNKNDQLDFDGTDKHLHSPASENSHDIDMPLKKRKKANRNEKKTKDQPPKKKVVKIIKEDRGGALRSLSKTLAYLSVVLVVSIALGVTIILVGNDIFAFVKSGDTVDITVSDEMTQDEIVDLLYQNGIIKFPSVFKFYIGLKDTKIRVVSGTYSVSPKLNYDQLCSIFIPRIERETISVTIPEGITTDEIIDIFVSKGLGTRAGFTDAINNYEYDYWFIELIPDTPDRYYRLDGYLYPDTYYFFTDSEEYEVIAKLLSNFAKKLPKKYNTACIEAGFTFDEILTLGSIIESEAKFASEYSLVSSVFHNRLTKKEFNKRLDSDATLQYYFMHTEGAKHPDLTAEDLATDTPYNTRRVSGLTPGPICNPSLNAFRAALNPKESNYCYFASKADGHMLFAATLKEHEENLKIIKSETAN